MSATFVQPCSRTTATIINPLLAAVAQTFRDVLKSEVRRQSLELRNPDAEVNDLTALILLTGRAKGAICVSFEELTALEIAARLHDGRYTKVTSAVLEALCEIASQVADATKSRLEMGLNMGLPSVVRQADFPIRFPADSQPMRVAFDSDVGPFLIDFGFVVTPN